MESQKRAPLWLAPTLPETIVQVWKWMQVANILAYYDKVKITAVKSFIVQAPAADRTKLFGCKFTHALIL